MSNILLNYAVPFSQVEALPAPSFGFLHTLAIAVLHDVAATPPDATLITGVEQLGALTTYGAEIEAAFDAGLSKILLIRVNTGAELDEIIRGKEGEFFTVYGHQSISLAEFKIGVESWKGVAGTVTSDPENIPDAMTKNFCLFGSKTTADSYNPIYAFGALLSAATWRNQQYIGTKKEIGLIDDLGIAETLFNDRVSFWLNDDTYGNRLGFFVAGGKSITTPYIDREITMQMQFAMTNFLTVNQPFNVAVERAELERIGGKMIGEYIELGYLDPEGVNALTVKDSTENFVVAGNLTTSPAVALWRIKMEAYQTQG